MSNDSMIKMSLEALRDEYQEALEDTLGWPEGTRAWILTCDDVAIQFTLIKRKYIVQKCNTMKAVPLNETEAKALAPAVQNSQGVQAVAVRLDDALRTSIRKVNEMLEQINGSAQLGFR